MSAPGAGPGALPVLVIAAAQGWLLYGLHLALDEKTWPATDFKWVIPLYAISVFVPLTLQVAGAALGRRQVWLVAAVIALAGAALGAYAGWTIEPARDASAAHAPSFIVFYFVFFCVWFIALPFAQTWLRSGGRRFPYSDLFEFSWQNELLLLEAAVFTGVFWLLLYLWASLFKVVDISFFSELFAKPVFVYPVTAIVFGYAIYLIQSRISVVVTVRRHLHGVFSWLFPLVAAIAVMFLAVLPFTGLDPLWRTGKASLLMLWLQVLLILFLNAAYEDGGGEPGYPGWLKLALRAAVLAMPVYAALCAYSLGLRIEQHGWSVDRVWAGLITLVALLYALGYSAAAIRRAPWMAGVARVNVLMAWLLIALLLLVSTPLLDPKRLSVDSQVFRLTAARVTPNKFDYDYLRFELGRYGIAALTDLAKSENQDIARHATATLAKPQRFGQAVPPAGDIAERIELFPGGASPDPSFLEYLSQAAKANPAEHPQCLSLAPQQCLALMHDLDRDGQPEMIFLGSWPQAIYSKTGGKWAKIGQLIGGHLSRSDAANLLRSSRYRAEPRAWSTLVVGDQRFTVQDEGARK